MSDVVSSLRKGDRSVLSVLHPLMPEAKTWDVLDEPDDAYALRKGEGEVTPSLLMLPALQPLFGLLATPTHTIFSRSHQGVLAHGCNDSTMELAVAAQVACGSGA